MKRAIQNRIEAINEMLPMVKEQSDFATTTAGSTYESYVILTQPIEVKNQFIYKICIILLEYYVHQLHSHWG